jgi:hypothetical protein
LYEGQLSNADQAISKINNAIEAGLAAGITIVHISSEQALHNTIHRFHLQGRGASIEAMASIQGGLPDSLRAVHELAENLERGYRSGDIKEDAYEQAVGKAPRDFTRRVARERSRGFER